MKDQNFVIFMQKELIPATLSGSTNRMLDFLREFRNCNFHYHAKICNSVKL